MRAAEDVGPYLADGFYRVEAARRTKDDMNHAMELVWDKWDTLYKKEKRTNKDGCPSR